MPNKDGFEASRDILELQRENNKIEEEEKKQDVSRDDQFFENK